MPIPVASFRGVLAVALVWLALVGLAAFELWPIHPSSFTGWLLFAMLAPPLLLLAESVLKWAWGTHPGKFISEHPSRLVRIALGVLVIGGALIVLSAVWIAVGRAAL